MTKSLCINTHKIKFLLTLNRRTTSKVVKNFNSCLKRNFLSEMFCFDMPQNAAKFTAITVPCKKN